MLRVRHARHHVTDECRSARPSPDPPRPDRAAAGRRFPHLRRARRPRPPGRRTRCTRSASAGATASRSWCRTASSSSRPSHGAGRLGAIVVPVNIHFKADEAGWIVADSGATAVVVARWLLPALDRRARRPAPRGRRRLRGRARRGARGEVDDPDVIGDGVADDHGLHLGHDRPARRASRSARTTSAAAPTGSRAGGERWGLGPDDVHLAVGPLYHSGPSYWAQMHLAPRRDRRGDGALGRRGGAAASSSATGHEHAHGPRELPADPRGAGATRDRLRHLEPEAVLHAAAPCPVPLKRAFMDFVGAGQGVGVLRRVRGRRHGHLAAGVARAPGQRRQAVPRQRVRDPRRRRQRAAGRARSAPSGCNPAASSFEYHNDAEKTAASHRERFFTVGDAGYLDEDGYLFLADRKSDMVITGGVNVYPREIEECLLGHDEIVDCAVLGVPDDEWGEVIYAIVQPTAGLVARRGRRWSPTCASTWPTTSGRGSSSSSPSCRATRTERCASRSSGRRTSPAK